MLWAALVVAVVLVALLTVAANQRNDQPLDPGSPKTAGAKAVAEVLRDRGIRVDVVRTADDLDHAGPGVDSTVLLTRGGLLSAESLRQVGRSARAAGSLVVIDADDAVLTGVGVPLREAAATENDDGLGTDGQDVRCGVAPFEGLRLRVDASTRTYTGAGAGCVRTSGRGDAVRVVPPSSTRPTTIAVGTADILRNDRTTDADGAAFALRALGAHRRLVWLAVDDAHADTAPASTAARSPWPRWVGPATWSLVVTVLLLMLWRGRRLGRIVPEQLPVSVPAAETALARAQLYRRARDTVRTTEILRIATRRRIAPALGLSPAAPPDAVSAATAKATGRHIREVHDVLAGPPASDEASMVSTARQLQELERQVHQR